MDQITNIREGLAKLTSALEAIVTIDTPATPDATINSISGNAIHGGKITLLRSTGIRDQASRTSLLVEDDKITVGSADIDSVVGDLTVEDNLTIGGELTAKTLRVAETFTDQKHNSSLDFQVEGDTRLIGLQWRKKGEATKQIVWRDDRFYISNNVDLHRDASYNIDNIPVIKLDSLGPTIKKSDLSSVGRLQNLQTDGDLTIDDYIFYESGTSRLGIGTEAPNGSLSVSSNEAEFIVDPDFDHLRVGAWTTSKMSLITDNKERIVIKQHGGVEVKDKLGVNVSYPGEDVDLEVKGNIRFNAKKFTVGEFPPTEGNYNLGDIQYDTNPRQGMFIGWVCIIPGNPGTWKGFGAIEK